MPGFEPVIVEKPNMNRRISTAHKQPVVQAAHPVLAPIDEATGEPAKLMKVPACWTPLNKRANAAFIYIFFRNVSWFESFVHAFNYFTFNFSALNIFFHPIRK